MNINFWFFVLLLVNFAISWWSSKTVGSVWSEAKQIGGSIRGLAVSGYIMAIAGFTMVYGCVLLLAIVGLYPVIPALHEAVELSDLIQFTDSLLYLLVILAVIPTGLIIWIHSLIAFWKDKSLKNGAIAGWNTYANVRNVISVARHAPSAFKTVVKVCFGGKGSKKGNAVLVMVGIFVTIMAVCGGWMTASAIMKKADREYDLFNEVRAA